MIKARRFSDKREVRLYEVEADSLEELKLVSEWCKPSNIFFAITGEWQGQGMIDIDRSFDLTLKQMEALPKILVFDVDCSNERCLYHDFDQPAPPVKCPRCRNAMEVVIESYYSDGELQYQIIYNGDDDEGQA